MRDALEAVRRRLESSGSRQTAAASVPSIAVLPFSDMSPTKDQDYFCEGMAEELINLLASLPGLQVTSRTSSFQFKGKAIDIGEIGARLKVETVLEGSVRKAGNRLRITAQLVKASDGYHLWSERYDRDMDDVFAVQDEIAQTIVEKLKVRFTRDSDAPQPRRGTDDIAAYQACLEGRYYWAHRNPGSLEKAIAAFDRAVKIDPTYARAHAGIADVYSSLTLYGAVSPAAGLAKAKPAADRAVALDEHLAEAHYTQFLIHVVFDGNFPSARRSLERALQIDPRFGLARASLAWLLALGGDEAAVDTTAAEAIRSEPVAPLVAYQVGLAYSQLSRLQRALESVDRALDLDENFMLGHWLRGQMLSALGRHPEALTAARRAVELSRNHSWFLSSYGVCLARAGDHDAARALLDRIVEQARTAFVDPVALASLYLAVGDVEHGFEQARLACEQRESLRYHWVDAPSMVTALASHPRYHELLPSGWTRRHL